MGDERFQLENIIWLSEIYIRDSKISIAEKYLKEAEQIIQKKSPFNLELIGIYAQFFKLYEKNKDFEKMFGEIEDLSNADNRFDYDTSVCMFNAG